MPSASFEIFNLVFEAARSRGAGADLPLFVADRQLSIVLMPTYAQRVRSLRSRRGVTGTATLSIPLASLAETEEAGLIADRVCDLLTLATGTLVTWNNSILTDDDGQSRPGLIRSAPTRGYNGGWPLIDRRMAPHLSSFVEQTYPVYVELEQSLQLRRVIHAYADAMSSAFLETRALLIGALGEFLTLRAAEVVGLENDAIPRPIVEHLHGAFVAEMDETLGRELAREALTSDVAAEIRQTVLDKLSHLGDRSLRQKLAAVNEHFNAGLSPGEIRSFVITRNNMAHRMEFSDSPDSGDQFRHMRYVVDRILLALLRYNGPFVDCRTLERHTR
jgi:hypothetical protein